MPKSLVRRGLRLSLSSLCLSMLLPAVVARAQYIMEFGETYSAPMSNFISGTVLNNLSMINTAPGQEGAPPLRAASAPQTARSARELAQRFPAAYHVKMAQLYTDSFAIYRKLEAKFGWPSDDMAGALAAFVVGNYMVYANTNVPDEHFVAVANQFRSHRGIAAAFRALKPHDLRAMYEQSAMVGTFMALTELAQGQTAQPAEVQARVRESARANLQQVLRIDPARLRVSAKGLTVL